MQSLQLLQQRIEEDFFRHKAAVATAFHLAKRQSDSRHAELLRKHQQQTLKARYATQIR